MFWLRVRVKNETGATRLLLALTATPEHAALYDDASAGPAGDDARPVVTSGTRMAFRQRPVADGEIVLPIDLPAHQCRTLWVQFDSQDTIWIDPVIWTDAAFWESRAEHRLLHGLYYGAMLALIAYNLFLYVFVRARDANYLRYVIFQLTTGLSLAAIDRYTFQYFWPDQPAWALVSIPALQFLSIAAGLAFARGFLDVRRLSPRLDAVMRTLCLADLALALCWAVAPGHVIDAAAAGYIVRAVAIAGGVLALASISATTSAAAFAAVRTRTANARIFLGAWLVLLAAGAAAVLHTLGVVASLASFALIKVGSGLEAVLLSLALASRINALTRDRERAQQAVLDGNAARIEALRRLVSGVAHEVGNPLNFARSGFEVLADHLEALAPAQDGTASARRAHRLVASGLARIQIILDNLRRYLSVGDPELVLTDLAREIADALELTDERLRAAGIRVATAIEPLPALLARPGQLHQVLLNLISNAIDAMPGGGELRLAARASDADVEISVADSGPGIAPVDRERVFEPFFTTRADAGGTGLGLAVAREIVLRNGGSIRVCGGEGGGATFAIRLPRPQGAR